MINVSNEFKQYVKSERDFIATATITLATGTVLNVTDAQIRSLKIHELVTPTNTFTVGGAHINELTIVLDNTSDFFSEYDFTDAIIRPSVGLQLSATIETLQKGVYTSDEFKTTGQVITIIALDLMNNFDLPFKEVTQVFPCTAQDLLNSICTHCGVSLATTTFTNDNYVIQTRPLDDATTCREILSWIAQIAGCFARCNKTGALELKWYDYGVFTEEPRYNGGTFDNNTPYASGDNINGGNFDDYSSGDTVNGGTFDIFSRYHHIFALGSINVNTDDVVITGLQVSDVAETPNTVLYGQSGYVIAIEKNYLIQSQTDAETIASSIGPKIVGMRFRPLSISAVSDPSREAGDVAYVTDRKRNTYQTLLTSVSFSITQNDKISCDAESPLKKKSVRYPETTKVLIEAKKSANQKLTAYDLEVKRMNMLAANTLGYYYSEDILSDGSKISYWHDKPTIAESQTVYKQGIDGFFLSNDGGQTYNFGRDSQGNEVVNILSAIGINADWVRAGRIISTSGSVLIDLDKGVANSDNISMSDNVADGYPLRMPFNIDDNTSVISKILLKFTIDKFRTYSTTAASGGGSNSTSSSGGGSIVSSESGGGGTTTTGLNAGTVVTNGSNTGSANAVNGHTHYFSYTYETEQHEHGVSMPSHNHNVSVPPHNHDVSTPSHTHGLDFGIMETDVIHNLIAVIVDGVTVTTVNDTQGIIDLTSYITTVGWHTIELSSATKKKISAQISIKSYIQM